MPVYDNNDPLLWKAYYLSNEGQWYPFPPFDEATHTGAVIEIDQEGFINGLLYVPDNGPGDNDPEIGMIRLTGAYGLCKMRSCYRDQDGDGHGNPDVSTVQCECPEGYVADGDDCDGFRPSWDSDPDGDGLTTCAGDYCPTIANPAQTDSDGDGRGDACDPDRDGDGIPNDTDNCPNLSNPDQADTDNDGAGDMCDDDDDNDGIGDTSDNCPMVSNPGQGDNDSDGVGDLCDDDDDNDGVLDPDDKCPTIANPDQGNMDNDGVGDVCDDDSDGDCLPNVHDPCPYDADCDDDGLRDGTCSPGEDLDNDGDVDPGETDPQNPDTDGDGIFDGTEVGLTEPHDPAATDISKGFFIADADPETITDPTNPNSDGDGEPDGVEDGNKNGKLDEGETNSGVYTVRIDIKPGSFPNCFNNDGHGVIPVAILGSADFDISPIDPSTIVLQGLAVKALGKKNNLLAHSEDVNTDGYLDLIVQIEDSDSVFSEGETIARLVAILYNNTPIEGYDSLCIVP
ncbi:MAG: thrombospondin type 3 repeat-containing protein [bacterium]